MMSKPVHVKRASLPRHAKMDGPDKQTDSSVDTNKLGKPAPAKHTSLPRSAKKMPPQSEDKDLSSAGNKVDSPADQTKRPVKEVYSTNVKKSSKPVPKKHSTLPRSAKKIASKLEEKGMDSAVDVHDNIPDDASNKQTSEPVTTVKQKGRPPKKRPASVKAVDQAGNGPSDTSSTVIATPSPRNRQGRQNKKKGILHKKPDESAMKDNNNTNVQEECIVAEVKVNEDVKDGPRRSMRYSDRMKKTPATPLNVVKPKMNQEPHEEQAQDQEAPIDQDPPKESAEVKAVHGKRERPSKKRLPDKFPGERVPTGKDSATTEGVAPVHKGQDKDQQVVINKAAPAEIISDAAAKHTSLKKFVPKLQVGLVDNAQSPVLHVVTGEDLSKPVSVKDQTPTAQPRRRSARLERLSSTPATKDMNPEPNVLQPNEEQALDQEAPIDQDPLKESEAEVKEVHEKIGRPNKKQLLDKFPAKDIPNDKGSATTEDEPPVNKGQYKDQQIVLNSAAPAEIKSGAKAKRSSVHKSVKKIAPKLQEDQLDSVQSPVLHVDAATGEDPSKPDSKMDQTPTAQPRRRSSRIEKLSSTPAAKDKDPGMQQMGKNSRSSKKKERKRWSHNNDTAQAPNHKEVNNDVNQEVKDKMEKKTTPRKQLSKQTPKPTPSKGVTTPENGLQNNNHKKEVDKERKEIKNDAAAVKPKIKTIQNLLEESRKVEHTTKRYRSTKEIKEHKSLLKKLFTETSQPEPDKHNFTLDDDEGDVLSRHKPRMIAPDSDDDEAYITPTKRTPNKPCEVCNDLVLSPGQMISSGKLRRDARDQAIPFIQQHVKEDILGAYLRRKSTPKK